MRNGILGYLETCPPAPFQHAAGYDTGDHQPLIAYDADVSHAASVLTQVALDAMLRPDTSEFSHSAYLIGFRREWIFSQPFDTCPIDVTGEGWNEPHFASDEQRKEVIETLLRLAAGNKHADPDSSS
jgi:hypothetical protein